MEEIWKDIFYTDSITGEIVDYRGLYQVSNLGRVKSCNKYVNSRNDSIQLKKGKLLKLHMSNTGYLRAFFVNNNKNRCFSVHRLVAHMFIPNPNNYPMVNHKDENRLNNKVYNLEWCTQSYNTRYGTAIARQVETQKRTMSTNKACLNVDTNKTYISISEAARENNVSVSALSSCLNKKNSTCGGYRWKFI